MEWGRETLALAERRLRYAKEMSGRHYEIHKRFSFLENALRYASLGMAFVVSTLTMVFREGNGNGSVAARVSVGAAGYLLTLVLAVEAHAMYSERSILHERASDDWEGIVQDIGDSMVQQTVDSNAFLEDTRSTFAILRERYPLVKTRAALGLATYGSPRRDASEEA